MSTGPVQLTANLLPAHSARVLTAFFEACQWAYDVWQTHCTLFPKRILKHDPQEYEVGRGLYRLSIITQEYLLHQIIKLHDPAIQNGHANVTLDYMIRFGGWNSATETHLKKLKTSLDQFASHLTAPRNKILSHNDLETAISGSTLGQFPAGEDVTYFALLQEFVDVIHCATVGLVPLRFNRPHRSHRSGRAHWRTAEVTQPRCSANH